MMSLKMLKSRYVAVLPAIVLVLVIAITVFPSAAVTTNNSTEYTLSVTGVGTVSAKADEALISLGVMTQEVYASDAVTVNAEKMSGVVVALKALGIPEDDIQTSWYSLYPVYEWNEEKRSQTIIGYQATNTITVTTANLALVGTIIDKATSAGVNNVNSITFNVSDEVQSQLEKEAFKKACADAKSKADVVAGALDVRIVGVKSISTSGGPSYPIYKAAEEVMPYPAYETPIFPGESEVTVTVYVEFLIENSLTYGLTNMIEVGVGQEFTITLDSNPTTGYQWQLAKPLDEGILQMISSEYMAPDTELVGTGGKEVWTFKAVDQGTTEISMKYIRPWENIPAKEQTFNIIVK